MRELLEKIDVVYRCGMSQARPCWIRCAIRAARMLRISEEALSDMSWAPVYRLVKRIPRGRVTTYGELAKALKLRGGARAVGYAMAACPSGQGIPWHRVIGAGGRMLMPEPYALKQRKLLETEGVAVEATRIDMNTYGWSPAKTKRPKPKTVKRAKRR